MAGADEFVRRTQQLEDEVGHGRITAGCEVDQPYAQNQHENMSFNHTVGRDHYLGDPLMENAFNLLDGIARAAVTPEGSRLRDEMKDIAEDLAAYVKFNAPKDPDVGDRLANSGSPYVIDGGMETYRRPPLVPRDDSPPESGWDEWNARRGRR